MDEYGATRGTLDGAQSALSSKVFMAKVYGWMTAALLITALVAMYVAGSEQFMNSIVHNRGLLIGLFIGELALVWILSASINRLSFPVAATMFVAYSALNGLTMSFIFLLYTSASIASTFFITAGTFGAMSLYGYTTKKDLSSWGSLLLMALIGLIIASVVNMFMVSTMLYWITTCAGVLIFVGLTAYDTQKIKNMGVSDEGSYTDVGKKMAILGALSLYLDFINLFLYLLRIFGRRR
jgi:FtsH-binding integral membrane protein